MVLEKFGLQGKTAIVTGGAQGLGRTISLALAEAGADVVVADILKEQLEQTRSEVVKLGRKSLAVTTDVAKSDEVSNLVEKTIKEFGRIDILVNNVGIAIAKPILEMEEREWNRVLNINLTSAFLCSKLAGAYMVKQGKGKVINISSNAGLVAAANQSAYCASKAGVILLTKCLALEWARYNINVNAIAPGYLRTSFSAKALEDENIAATLLKRIPLRRFGETTDIAPLVIYLASSASDYMTGETVLIDGGHLCHL